MVVTQEVDELAFLFGQELGLDLHRLGWVSGVDPHRLSFLEWAEGCRGGWLVAVRDYWGRQLPEPMELGRVEDKVLPIVMTPFGPGIFSFR